MYPGIHKRMQGLIERGQYVMTLHAEDEMCEDDLTIEDVKSIFQTGRIIERQRDKRTRESKYLIEGRVSQETIKAVVVAKFGFTGKVVILTIFLSKVKNGGEHEV